MCIYGGIIKNKKYTATKKNGGVIPAIRDKRQKYSKISCGSCVECRKAKTREWQIRLTEETKSATMPGKFVTLTFSEESLRKYRRKVKAQGYEGENEAAKIAVRHFFERWRQRYKKGTPRHWLVTELGHQGTERIHIHGFIWTNLSRKEVLNLWGNGFMFPRTDKQWAKSYVSERTVNYCTKYMLKQDLQHKEYKPRMFCSKGIGAAYLDRTDRHTYKGENTKETYVTRTGHELPIPSYYRRKLWTDKEREDLWSNRLDKGVIYINGREIDITGDDKNYMAQRFIAQERNARLGYAQGTKNWEKKRESINRRKEIAKIKWEKETKRIEETGKISAIQWGEIIDPTHIGGLSPSADSCPTGAAVYGADDEK